MRNYLKIALGLFFTPWLYVYSLVSIAGEVAAQRNSGVDGSPLLGATGIISTVTCLCLFYWQLAKLRQVMFPKKVSGLSLFLSTFAFRIRLLLATLPVVALFYFLGHLKSLSDGFLRVTIAQPEEQFALYLSLLGEFWPLAIAVFVTYVVDNAGRSVVVAKGFSDHALRHSVLALKKLWLPILAFSLIGNLGFATGEYLSGFDNLRPWDSFLTLRLIFDCLVAPVEYAIYMSMLLYLAQRIYEQAPELIGPAVAKN